MNLKNIEKIFYPPKNKYFYLYSFLFLAVSALFFFWHIKNQKSFILPGDALSQHYLFLMYYGRYLRSIFFNLLSGNFSIPFYDFNIGYGSDIINTLHYYVLGDPLTLLSFFVPSKHCAYLYNFLFIFRLYLAGMAFSFYCFKTNYFKNADNISVLIGAFCYIFSGYTLLLIYVPSFLNPLIYFPLLLIGMEKILNDESPVFFIAMVFISLISNFYCFYILTAMLFVWTTVKFIYCQPKTKVLKLIFYYAAGICCAGIVFVPNLANLFQMTRFNENIPINIFYNLDIYKRAFLDFITPPSNLLAIPYGFEMTGFTIISLIAVVTLFLQTKKYKELKTTFILFTLCAFIPFCGYIFTAFSYVSNRWMFAYTFLISLITATIIKDVFCSEKFKKYLFVFLIINLSFNSFYFFYKHKNEQSFLNANEAFNALTKNALQLPSFLDDKYFFRVESVYEKSANINAAMIEKFKGTTFYFSCENSNISKFMKDLELNRISSIMSYGLDGRAMLGALANVKYFITQGEKFLPYGYEKKIASIVAYDKKTYDIYENNFALPFGYSYSCFLRYENFEKLSAVQKQQALMQAVVLEKTPHKDFNVLENLIFKENFYKVSISKNNQKEHIVDNTVLSFPLTKKENSESYVRFGGIFYSGDAYAYAVVDEEINKNIYLAFPKYLGSFGKQNFTLNMTYYDKAEMLARFITNKTGTLSLNSIEVISLPIGKHFENQVKNLKKDCLREVQEGVNKISGRITLSENKILLLSIPYSKGWKAFVNGQEEELLRANIMFMALPLKAGTYEIELKYLTPGLKLGAILSLLGFIIFAIIALKRRRTTLFR